MNANDIEIVITHLRHIYTLFGSKYISNDVNTLFRYLENEIKRIELQKEVEQYQENTSEDQTDEGDDDKEESIKKSKKPFLPYVLKRLEKCKMTCYDETPQSMTTFSRALGRSLKINGSKCFLSGVESC